MPENNILVSLSDLTCLTVSGRDATSFLHGQFCADLLSVPTGGGCLTAWCTARGRVITTLIVFRLDEGWSLVLPANLATRITQRLRMFVLRANVELHPPAADAVLLGLNGEFATTINADLRQRLLRHPALNGPVKRFFLPASTAEYAVLSATQAARTSVFNTLDWAQYDVESGLPWVGGETSEQFLPQELNLERWHGLSYTKGCYPGQEIVARLRYRGTVKRGLFRLQAAAALRSTLVPGRRLLDATGNPAATVLYAGGTESGGLLALAVADFSAPPAPAFYCEPGGAQVSVIGPVETTT